ncbi:toll-like receptor 3 isoform X2 [Acanthaster planci]|nr:toll-like receptor 3 isoform X2 [Acanthaster planci]XP_022106328.1 toll-like receptor 3 isoform X2 [Acanthaster planci]
MRINTAAVMFFAACSVINFTQRTESHPLPGAHPHHCPMKCRCVTVSRRLLAASRRLQQYAAMFDWVEGAGAAVCWGKKEVPVDLLPEVSYLLLVGDDSRTGIIDYDMTGSAVTSTAQPDSDERVGRIKDIPLGTFADGVGLVHLDLRGNKIAELEPGSLMGLGNLQILSLKGNRLRALPKDAFQDVQNLTQLFLSDNHIRSVQTEAFINNTHLLELDIGDNLLEVMSPGSLRGLTYLRFLNLSHNRLTHLPEDLLVDQLELQQLILNDNKVESLSKNIFAKNSNLKLLSLKNNRLRQLPESVFISLTNLLELDLSGNNLIALADSIFPLVSALKFVNMSHNALVELSKVTFENCTHLRKLVASSNRLSAITDKTFGQLSSLQELFLDRNNISTILPHSLQGLNSLKILDITNNALQRLQTETFYGLEALTSLRLDNNKITDIEQNAFSVSAAHSMSKLTWLYLRGNDLRELSADMFGGAPFVKMLNLADNKISTIDPSSLRRLRRLVTLSLHGNRLGSLQDRAFSEATNVQSLDLSGNSLHRVDEGAFHGLNLLLELNMADNELDETTSDWLASLTSLNLLNLNGNRFSRVPATLLTSLPDLSHLYLKRNILDTFRVPDHDRFRGLFLLNIADNNLQTIEGGLPVILAPGSSVDLSGNPWICNCALVADVREMISVNIRFEKENETLCTVPGQANDRKELTNTADDDSALCGLEDFPPIFSTQSDGLVKSSKAAPRKPPCENHPVVSRADGTWPWYAVVWSTNNATALCNAALIGVDWAVTTLRCLQQIQRTLSSSMPNIFRDIVKREKDSLLMAPRGLVIRLGKSRFMDEFEADEQGYRIMNMHIPGNDHGTGLDRPLLLQFSSLARVNEQVSPVCIANYVVKVQRAISLGWGMKPKETPPEEALQSSRMKLEPCDLSNNAIEDVMLCGVRERGRPIDYSIDGNMGGALATKRGRSDWALIGIGSRIEKGVNVFIDLTRYEDWIDGKTAQTRSR